MRGVLQDVGKILFVLKEIGVLRVWVPEHHNEVFFMFFKPFPYNLCGAEKHIVLFKNVAAIVVD